MCMPVHTAWEVECLCAINRLPSACLSACLLASRKILALATVLLGTVGSMAGADS